MMKVWANKNLMRRSVELMLIEEHGSFRAFGMPMELIMKREMPEDEGLLHEPTLSIPLESAQALLQALWNEGFRPDTGEGAAAVTEALKQHIKFAERVADTLLKRPQRR